ncbi:methionyl-tRNA synthetase [Nonlabens dokdonensis]|uniref:Methionine--tRNA ligase n=2 Tax=Nonlabens dokdonensis TaxID=328515 RepID=L7W9U1_NONDD|nr:methionine--tRNA ligase [Nonlabens dokdonensis]AGC76884.1 methionine--tRNA ligase, metS [Nonlabens dokdonensis DSW-6]PZX36793.1 methionyl-tRNA synthetase [Nonlabens dokdonensis]
MSDQKRFTITAALPYTNGPVHIGHLAGVYVPADIFARYQRMKGSDVAFICGSDEHGVPITIKAKKEGITPQELVDRYHKIIDDSFKEFGISFDHYGRTSAPTHHETASAFFTDLYNKGKFVEKVTEQLYDPEADQFLADRFVVGTCPKCGNPESYGDQCEKCGTSHNGTDLIDPKSAITGNTPELKETKHWFLPLDEYSDWLNEWIVEGHSKDWKTNVLGQVKSWITDGLHPRAVTRDLDWGIPVPVNGADGKVLYVWFDAPIGYISATKEWAAKEGKNWEDYWKNEDTSLLHFIGKDNIVFHCIIFPAMLKAHGDYILPENVPANEFLNLEDDKISTSRNWAVWLHEYLLDFPGQQDVLRYVLTANAPETKDNNFTWKDFQARNNNELVANLGNFVNRVIVLTNKYYDGIVPEPQNMEQRDIDTLELIKTFPNKIGASLERFRFRESLNDLMALSSIGNKYIAEEGLEPWKLVKTNPEQVQNIMYVCLQLTTALAILSEPFLPHTSQKLKNILDYSSLDAESANWSRVASSEVLLPSGHNINKSELLFSKIEDEQIQAQFNKLEATKAANAATIPNLMPQKDETNYDDFMKMDLRVGEILTAERMPKTDKLMVMTVDTGIDKRTIVSGIAQYFTAEELIGRKVTVLANLAPRKLRGVESQGMILLAEDPEGKLIFVNPDDAVVNGATIA